MYRTRKCRFFLLLLLCIAMLVPCGERIMEHYDNPNCFADIVSEKQCETLLFTSNEDTVLNDIPYVENMQSGVTNVKALLSRRAKEGDIRISFVSFLVILFKITVIPSVIYALVSELLRYHVTLQLLILGCLQKKDGKKDSAVLV